MRYIIVTICSTLCTTLCIIICNTICRLSVKHAQAPLMHYTMHYAMHYNMHYNVHIESYAHYNEGSATTICITICISRVTHATMRGPQQQYALKYAYGELCMLQWGVRNNNMHYTMHYDMHCNMHMQSYACWNASLNVHIESYACYYEGSATIFLSFDSDGWKSEIPTLSRCVLRAAS